MAANRTFKMLPGDEARIDKLQPSFQEILRATGTYQEIATKLGVALGTVRSRLNRARAALMLVRDMEAEAAPPHG